MASRLKSRGAARSWRSSGSRALRSRFLSGSILVLLFCRPVLAQAGSPPPDDTSPKGAPAKAVDWVFNYLTMAGAQTAADFRPLTQHERNRLYLKSVTNPLLYLKGALSGAVDLAKDKPPEWEQGMAGYGQRVGNILGQYGIQRTVTFGLSSLLHEDNRYFGSGKKGFWRRTGYALRSSVMARHDSGRQYPSFSLLAGFGAGAFLSRAWQPPSTHSAGDGAVSFGISMGFNTGVSVLKEFLPNLVAPILRGHQPRQPPASPRTP